MNKKILVILVLILVFVFSTTALASLTFTTDAITGTSNSAIDLGTGNTLYFQNTNNGPITTGTGLVTLGGSLTVTGSATFPTLVANRIPLISTGGLITSDAGIITQGVAGEQKIVGTANATFTVCASNSLNKNKCDYVATGTADEVTIQAAIDALPATGGRVILMDGTFNTTSAILTRYGLWLQGQGAGTIIQAGAGTWAPNRAVIVAKNDAAVKGATAGNDITVSDMTINIGGLANVAGVYSWGYASASTNVAVRRCKIKNSGASGYGVYGTTSADLTVSNSWFETLGDSAIEVRASTRTSVIGNAFNSVGALQVYADAGSGGVTMTGNLLYNSSVFGTYSTGVYISGFTFTSNIFKRGAGSSAALTLKNMDGAVVTGNVFDNSAETSAFSNAMVILSSVSPVTRNVIIANNTFSLGTASSGAISYPGIQVSGADVAIISENMIYTPGTTTSTGILVDNAAAAGVVIEGNTIKGAGAGASRVGISVASATGVHLEGNHFDTLETGVSVAASATGTRVVGPLWTTSVTVPITNSGTGTKYAGISSLLPTYADNTAALAGGLVAGDPYRTATGVFMVTY
jgi:hypothetical protein